MMPIQPRAVTPPPAQPARLATDAAELMPSAAVPETMGNRSSPLASAHPPAIRGLAAAIDQHLDALPEDATAREEALQELLLSLPGYATRQPADMSVLERVHAYAAIERVEAAITQSASGDQARFEGFLAVRAQRNAPADDTEMASFLNAAIGWQQGVVGDVLLALYCGGTDELDVPALWTRYLLAADTQAAEGIRREVWTALVAGLPAQESPAHYDGPLVLRLREGASVDALLRDYCVSDHALENWIQHAAQQRSASGPEWVPNEPLPW